MKLPGMKLLHRAKDGGPESTVTGYWLAEIKALFSAALLHFADGSRDSYHSHAFNSVSWIPPIGDNGMLVEHMLTGEVKVHLPSWKPIITRRSTFHRVVSHGDTWVITLRGPWARTWEEFNPATSEFITLTHGRQVVV